jgi:hypothetical protein
VKFLSAKFDRNELSGSFGDIGTDLPLIVGIILASGIDVASALIMFGVMQIFTALKYGIPMSVQPLKAFATIVIAQKLNGSIIFTGGLLIGIIMLLFTVTGLVKKIAELMPKSVIRGIQFGLGIQLAMLSIKNYIMADATSSTYILVTIVFIIGLILLGNKKYPPAIFIIAGGILFAFFSGKIQSSQILSSIGFSLPKFNFNFSTHNMIIALWLLVLPQIPLSIGNSILATKQVVNDFFPDKKISTTKISYTYSLMNIINPFFSGIPTCHGSGGIAGHYTFGARTSGSIIIYGSFFLIGGLFFANGFHSIINFFPLPILGVILFFESITLITLMKDIAEKKSDLYIAIIVGLMSAFLPYGYAMAMILGTLIYYFEIPKTIFFDN